MACACVYLMLCVMCEAACGGERPCVCEALLERWMWETPCVCLCMKGHEGAGYVEADGSLPGGALGKPSYTQGIACLGEFPILCD